jgi:hypothetical protein
VHIFGAINLSGLLDVPVGSQRILHQAAHLLFVFGVPLDRLDDQAVGGAAGLLGRAPSARSFGGNRMVVVSACSLLQFPRQLQMQHTRRHIDYQRRTWVMNLRQTPRYSVHSTY